MIEHKRNQKTLGFARERVTKSVDNDSFLNGGSDLPALELKPSLLEHSPRGRVEGVRNGVEPNQAELFERKSSELLYRIGHDSFTPIRFPQPVTEFCCQAMDIGACANEGMGRG